MTVKRWNKGCFDASEDLFRKNQQRKINQWQNEAKKNILAPKYTYMLFLPPSI